MIALRPSKAEVIGSSSFGCASLTKAINFKPNHWDAFAPVRLHKVSAWQQLQNEMTEGFFEARFFSEAEVGGRDPPHQIY